VIARRLVINCKFCVHRLSMLIQCSGICIFDGLMLIQCSGICTFDGLMLIQCSGICIFDGRTHPPRFDWTASCRVLMLVLAALCHP
jgi:hypothetical protein